jgi:hypothetical protein
MDLSTRPLLASVGKPNKGLADSNLVWVVIDKNRAHAWGILVFVPGQCMFKQDCPAESSRANNFPFQIWGIHTPKVEKTTSSLCLSSEYKIPGSFKPKKISLLNSMFGGSLSNNYSFHFDKQNILKYFKRWFIFLHTENFLSEKIFLERFSMSKNNIFFAEPAIQLGLLALRKL